MAAWCTMVRWVSDGGGSLAAIGMTKGLGSAEERAVS